MRSPTLVGIVDNGSSHSSIYSKRAEELVNLAESHNQLRIGERPTFTDRRDDKMYVSIKDIACLVGAGATVKHMNTRMDRNYYHQVAYNGYNFISTSEKPVAISVRPGLK